MIMKFQPALSVLITLLTFLLPAQAASGQLVSSGTVSSDSAYVTRMMSLDRDGDGFLDSKELPGKLAELLSKHDANSDGKLDTGELSAVEALAQQSRMAESPAEAQSPAGHGGRAGRSGGGPGQNRPGANRPAGGRRTGDGVQGSPLDAAQILRFALTFDADKDGGLGSEELKRYATALAARRAAAQQSRSVEAINTGEGKAPNTPERPRGLAAPQADATDDPFGND